MTGQLTFAFFAHSWTSDWNHGNAHFLRGLVHELMNLGHRVRCYEQVNSWSRSNLQAEGWGVGDWALQQFEAKFSHLDVRFYTLDEKFATYAAAELRDVDVVVVHEWNPPELVNTIASLKDNLGFVALFHDTHHRAYTQPEEVLKCHLGEFDGVLAFGEAIRRIYVEGFGVPRAWTFHEAADTAHFQPMSARKNTDVIWVGNWGDEERTRELEEFLDVFCKDHRIPVHHPVAGDGADGNGTARPESEGHPRPRADGDPPGTLAACCGLLSPGARPRAQRMPPRMCCWYGSCDHTSGRWPSSV